MDGLPSSLAVVESQTIDRSKKLDALISLGRKKRDPWVPQWTDAYTYAFPMRQPFQEGSVNPGARGTDDIYDQTAVVGVPAFASRLQNGIFPPGGRAFSLTTGRDWDPAQHSADAIDQLATITDVFHDGLRHSNFEAEFNEGLQDLAIGTMTMYAEEGDWPGDLRFTAVPHDRIMLLPGPNDSIGTWIYERPELTAFDMQQMWPKGTLPERVLQAAKSAPETTYIVWDITEITPTKSEPNSYRQSIYLKSERHLIQEREYKGLGSCSWITARWSKRSAEVYGRGPLMQVMPSIKTANVIVEYVLRNAELAISGMYAYDDDGTFNPDTFRVEPGVFIPRAPGSKIEALASPARFDVSSLVLDTERQNIRKGLFIDELEREAKTPMSAEEVSQRRADIARSMGAVSGRLMYEFIAPLINRIAYIYTKQGFVKMPRIDGKVIRIQPESPILRVRDGADISNFLQYTQVLNAALGQAASASLLNATRTANYITERFHIPGALLNSKKELAAAMQAAAGAVQEAGAAPDVMAAAVEKGFGSV